MAYSSGGLIEAVDYNGFVGTSPSSTANTINTVWAVGNGQYGMGQTAIPQVASTNTVTATQWSSLINSLNSIRTHQTGSGSGIAAVTAGATINYLSTLSTAIAAGYTSAGTAAFASQGTTTTGATFSPNFTSANDIAAFTFTATRTVTFASADQARYFFNCGGQLNFVISSSTNGNATNRSADLVTLASTNFVSLPAFRALNNGGRSGTGGTVNTAATGVGYYGLTTTDQVLSKITSTTTAYTSDYIQLAVKSNGTQGTNGDKGTVITFTLTLYSGAQTAYAAPPANPPATGTTTNNTTTEDAINVTINHRIDVVYPETTNLSNSWGTVTIA